MVIINNGKEVSGARGLRTQLCGWNAALHHLLLPPHRDFMSSSQMERVEHNAWHIVSA